MAWIAEFLANLWHVVLEAAPWLLLGLVVSGLIKVYLPTGLLQRWLGGRGVAPIFTAAVIGTPLPLCSCSVVPAALTLRRGGASRGATVSFLVSTPENGADSVALSWALLGPFMTVARPVAAVFSAVLAGVLTRVTEREDADEPQAAGPPASPGCCSSAATASCATDGVGDKQPERSRPRPLEAVRYAADDLFGDIAGWLTLGIVLAALVQTLVPPGTIAGWGSGLPAMPGVMLLGIPMYLCATASTPVAAALLLAGVSPGTALVFLLAGPATNLGTIGIVRKELGGRACAAYLVGACGGALACGLAADRLVVAWSVDVVASVGESHEMLPGWLGVGSAAVLGGLLVRWLLPSRAAGEGDGCGPATATLAAGTGRSR